MSNNLLMILEKIGPNKFRLYGCRGEGKGCTRNKYRSSKVHCDDCVPALDESETLAQFKARLERGDA